MLYCTVIIFILCLFSSGVAFAAMPRLATSLSRDKNSACLVFKIGQCFNQEIKPSLTRYISNEHPEIADRLQLLAREFCFGQILELLT
jgi:hypothetical protein